MRHFLVIMMFGVLAFASAFLQVDIIMIKNGTIEAPEIDEDANWYDKYFGFYNLAFKDSILTSLGQFDENILEFLFRLARGRLRPQGDQIWSDSR